MPEATLATFNLGEASASELNQRRANIVARYTGTTSLDDMSIEDLKELAAITSALRKKTTSAPKSAKKSSGTSRKPKAAISVNDVLDAI